jgi:hypothetical protein
MMRLWKSDGGPYGGVLERLKMGLQDDRHGPPPQFKMQGLVIGGGKVLTRHDRHVGTKLPPSLA